MFAWKPKILDTVGPGCVCEKKDFVLLFCIMQQVEMTLDDGAVKM